MNTSKTTELNPQIPDKFQSVITDFLNDLSITFPEYSHLWNKWSDSNISDSELQSLFNYLL